LFFSESLGLMFAACFFISVFTFPWIQAFAKNLYWIPFTWFLPAVFTLKYYLASNTKYSFLWLVGFFFSVLFKSMCGYEYISTIILFASAIFLIDPFLENPIRSKNHSFLLFTLTCLIATLAFFTALIFHAYTRGDTIGAGLLNIFDEDVKRSTIVVIDSVYKSHIDVLKRFIFKRAYYMLGIGGKFFGIAFILALTISTLKIFTNKPSRARDFVLLAVFSMAPMSWFILAKEHSRLHTHISFVLWCLGCSAAIWFIIVKNIKCIFFKILDLNRIKVSRTYF